jgi:hypothetical protein
MDSMSRACARIGEKGHRVVPGGRIAPQSSLIELKTKKDSPK